MADGYIRISELIRIYETRADDIARRLASGTSYEDYLRGVGRYKATVGFIDSLRAKLEKRLTADPDFDEDENEPDIEEEAGPAEPKAPARHQKPRAWGGR